MHCPPAHRRCPAAQQHGMSLWVSIPPNTARTGWVRAISDVMLAMSALLEQETGQRVGSRLTESDGHDKDDLWKQASLKSQPFDETRPHRTPRPAHRS